MGGACTAYIRGCLAGAYDLSVKSSCRLRPPPHRGLENDSRSSSRRAVQTPPGAAGQAERIQLHSLNKTKTSFAPSLSPAAAEGTRKARVGTKTQGILCHSAALIGSALPAASCFSVQRASGSKGDPLQGLTFHPREQNGGAAAAAAGGWVTVREQNTLRSCSGCDFFF